MASGGFIWRQLCAVVLCIKLLLRKAICRVTGRQRKNSGSILPLTQDHIASDMKHPVPTNTEYEELQPWDSWNTDDQMGGGFPGYNSSSMDNVNQRSNQQPAEPPPEPNFFEDMTPTIKKNPKILYSPEILIKKTEDSFMSSGVSSRLAFAGDVPVQIDPSLGSWDDQENAWGDELGEDLSGQADASIRERRRIEREQKIAEHQRKKIEKDSLRTTKRAESAQFSAMSAVKLS